MGGTIRGDTALQCSTAALDVDTTNDK
uniref:Uncharacterized protein n=1 Tax=Romanomermis culicivorax TaxID=13658 RepID=A0A915JBZ8_ROMCU